MGTGHNRDDEGGSEKIFLSRIVVPDDVAALDFAPRWGLALHHDEAVVLSERMRFDYGCLRG